MNSLQRRQSESLAGKLAEFFKARPDQWINGLDLKFAGNYAWRSRVSDCRKAPYFLRIRNRQRRLRLAGGRIVTISEYCYELEQKPTEEGAADAASTSSAAV